MADEGKMVQVIASDGFAMDAFEVSAGAGRRGGIVILQEIFGVTEQLKSVARAYSRQGYDAMVPALFDRSCAKTVVPFSEPDRGRQIVQSLDKEKLMLDIAAAVAHIDHGKGVSVIGFCWGGGVAVRCAMELPLRGAAIFYGTALPSYLGRPAQCPMIFHFGATDPNSPPEVIEAVRKAIPSAETHVYQAGHAFANDARANVYVREAADLAHARTFAFLNNVHPK